MRMDMVKPGAAWLKEAMRNRRLKLLEADPTVLMRVMAGIDRGAAWRVPMALNLPDDAHVVGVLYDGSRDVFYFKLASAEFGSVPLGGVIPEIHVEYMNVDITKDAQERLDGYRRELEHVAGELTSLADEIAANTKDCEGYTPISLANAVLDSEKKLRELAGNVRIGLQLENAGGKHD